MYFLSFSTDNSTDNSIIERKSMSRADDSANDLESYGVWVKNSKSSENDSQPSDDSLESLPDFDDADFSDMFKDDSQFSTESAGNPTDSADDIPGPAKKSDDLPDFQEITADDFSFDASDNAPQNEKPDDSEEIAFGEDEEISLDDFMDGGFSDESVAAGNNGFEPGKGPDATAQPGETEELSLDDFMDGDFSVAVPEEAQKAQEEIIDEKPLEMDITFDDSADLVEREDNITIENDFSDDDYDSDTISESQTEEVSIDDFSFLSDSAPQSSPAEERNPPASSGEISTEEVDLSDFGIDASAEETPVTQDVEEAKNKEKVIDYDLTVGDENMSTAPVVNEIKQTASSDKPENPEAQGQTVPANATVVENSLLQQIVSDLAGLKDEINKIKGTIAEMKSGESHADISADASDEPVIPADEDANSGGFFDADDTDETIALSGDELSNIFSTAEFSEADSTAPAPVEISEPESDFEEPAAQSEEPAESPAETSEEIIESAEMEADNPAETPAEEIISEEIPEEEPAFEDEAGAFELPDFEEPIVEDEPLAEEVSGENVFEEPVAEETSAEEDIADAEPVFADEPSQEETAAQDRPAFDFEDEPLTEPDFDTIEEASETEQEDFSDLPEEISIPQPEELVVESVSSDFINSVADTTEKDDEIPTVEKLLDEKFDDKPSADEEIAVEAEAAEETPAGNEDTPIEEEISFDNEPALEVEEAETEEISADTADVPVEDEVSFDNEPVLEIEEAATEEPSAADETQAEEEFADTEIFAGTDELSEIESVPEEMVAEETAAEPSEEAQSEDAFADVDVFEPADEPSEPELQSAEEEPAAETSDELASDDDFTTTDDFIADEPEPVEAEEIAQNITTETPAEEFFSEVDNLDNKISDSNLDYLTAKKEQAAPAADDTALSGDLKQDIKSVLLYMDQLLENLPEEKIIEFAKSQEFVTYKKLFNELGLS